MYPNPVVAKPIIGIWSSKEKPYWDRVYAASLLEYNPIENYRRTETESIEDDRTEQHSGTDTQTSTGSETNTGSSTSTDTNSGTDTETNSVTGYDSNSFVAHDKSEMAHGHVLQNQASGNNTNTHNGSNSMQHGEKIVHDGTTERSVLAYGNIGVTTSQDMLTQEMEIAKIINVIPIIIESFKNRFCLMVY